MRSAKRCQPLNPTFEALWSLSAWQTGKVRTERAANQLPVIDVTGIGVTFRVGGAGAVTGAEDTNAEGDTVDGTVLPFGVTLIVNV